MDDFSVAHLLFDGARLTLAREYAGLRKVELARVIEVTPGAITQFEPGRSKPSRGTVAALSLALGFAPAFFRIRAAGRDGVRDDDVLPPPGRGDQGTAEPAAGAAQAPRRAARRWRAARHPAAPVD